MPEPVLEARDVIKSFGKVQALRGANFTVYPNEVVALIGDNGAGKSTLVKTLIGVHPPDSGQILFEGKPVSINTPHDSRDLGIETVYQDLALAAEIDPAANMFMGRELMRSGVAREARLPRQGARCAGAATRPSRTSASRSRTPAPGSRTCPAASARASRSAGP